MLVKYELKKLLRFSVFLLIILSFAVKIFTIHSSAASIDMNEQSEMYYIAYLHQFEGPLTREKEESILKLKFFIEDTLDKYEDMKQAYISNQITKSEYDVYLSNAAYCRKRNESFGRLYNDYIYIKTARIINPLGAEPEFVYSGYWRKLLSPYSFDMILGLLMIVLISSLITIEYSGDMLPLMRSSMKGRRNTLYAKMLTGGGIIFILAFVFSLTELITYFSISYLPNPSAPIQSLEYFTGFPFNISLRTLAVIGVIGKPATATLISEIFILAGYIIKKRNTLIAAMIIMLFIPLFLSSVLPAVYAFLPPSLLNFYNIIRYITDNYNFPIQLVILLCIVVLYAFIMWILMRKVTALLSITAKISKKDA